MRNRRIGVWVGITALVAVVLAGALSSGTTKASPAARQAGTTPTAAAAGPTAPATATATVAAVVAPTTTAVTQPPSALALTCPPTKVSSPLFGHDITAPAPYRVTITYGDGQSYTNDSAHLRAIFSHTYRAHGSYPVTAVLTDSAGRQSTATCTYSW